MKTIKRFFVQLALMVLAANMQAMYTQNTIGTVNQEGRSLVEMGADQVLTASADYYSRRMVESHGKAWSADKSWDYVSGLVTKALLKCTSQYPEDAWSLTAYDWCKYYADKALNSDGSFKAFKKGNIDNIASGKVFFELYHRELEKDTEDGKANAAKYKVAVDYLYNYLRNEYSRIQLEDGKNGFFHKDIYPNQMWLDGLYMGAAFYAEYLANFLPDDVEGWADIANQFITIHRHTYDPQTKLNYHGWSADPTDANSFWANRDGDFKGCSSEFWGRGMGWYFAALVDVLEVMPESHTNYADLKEILTQVAEGLKQWQDEESGVWYQLLQYDETFVGECGKSNYLEASASCMFTYAYLKSLRLGLIDESYRSLAEKAYAGVLHTFVSENSDKTLNLNFSCKSAGLGPAKNPQRDGSASYYLCGSDVTMVSNEGKSIGPFIMASLEWEQVYGNDATPFISIALDKTSVELTEGETITLTATVTPDAAADKTVVWSTTDAAVATVEDGVVKAWKEGTAIVTAMVDDKKATCTVTVKAKVEIVIPEDACYFWQGAAGGAEEKGGVATGHGVADGRINYVNADYYTLCVSAKKANIDNDYILVTLDEPLQATDKMTITAYRNKDNDANGTLYILFDNGYAIDEGSDVIWNNIHQNYAQEPNTNTYEVGEGAGSKSIKLTRSKSGTNVFITQLVITREPVVEVTDLALSHTTASLEVGDSLVLKVEISPKDATDKTVTWSTSDANVAVVDGNGVVNGVAPGVATIIAMAGDKTASCVVTVSVPDSIGQMEDEDTEQYNYDLMGRKLKEDEKQKNSIYIVNGNKVLVN